MNLRMIRWRLPLSYAGIALLATLAMGAVMLAVLRQYYTGLERSYLISTAQSMRLTLQALQKSDPSRQAIVDQIAGLAFVSQTRVRLLDLDENVVFDSGVPHLPRLAVRMESSPSAVSPLAPQGGVGGVFFSAPEDESGPVFDRSVGDGSVVGGKEDVLSISPPITFTRAISSNASFVAVVPGPATVYGFSLDLPAEQLSWRSSQNVRLPLIAASGAPIGSLLLSDGPAYGTEIVASAGRAWLLASSVAVLLAGAAGWVVSRRMTRPLNALTAATRRMAQGDLSARAEITSRDELETLAQSFNQMAERIEETVVMLRHFASDAAHELQTPLTALRTNLDLAGGAAGDNPTAQTQALVQAQAQLERLSALTQGLLDLARIESGAGMQERTHFDLGGLAREASEAYAARAEQLGLAFALELPDGPTPVEGSPGQLRRALANLLDNAIKFTPAGGAVTLGGELLGDEVCLWVQDTGIGIPEEDLPQVFNRFHRGRNTGGYPGSGLGLAIVHAILSAHGGRLEVTSPAQGGTKACIFLICQPPKSHDAS